MLSARKNLLRLILAELVRGGLKLSDFGQATYLIRDWAGRWFSQVYLPPQFSK